MSHFVLVTISPSNLDVILRYFNPADGAVGFVADSRLQRDSSHRGTCTRLCLHWGRSEAWPENSWWQG